MPVDPLLKMIQDELGEKYDPLLEMVKIARDEESSNSLRLQANKEIAKYIHAQKQSVQVNANIAVDWQQKQEAINSLLDIMKSEPND